MMNTTIQFQDLGKKDYKETWLYQEELFKQIVDLKIQNRNLECPKETPNYFLYVEHPHVYTIGKSGDLSNLLLSEKQLEVKGATFYKINRGGDITYHGPGQIVGYPILDLENFFTDIHLYLRMLEEAIIRTCEHYGLVAGRITGLTGVWIDPASDNPRKICAFGVKASRWISMHGFALNVNTDLTYFGHIVPCGIATKGVTSLQQELGRIIDTTAVKEHVLNNLQDLFLFNMEHVSRETLPKQKSNEL